MIDAESHRRLRHEITARMVDDRALLDALRTEVRPLRSAMRRIQPRSTTALSLVGTDGGNTTLQFDPFLVQIVRVVDSSDNEYCLEAITPSTSVSRLSAAQFEPDGTPRTPLGAMMAYLGVPDLTDLSPIIRPNDDGQPVSPRWVQVYRELVEWAILFSIIRTKDFGTDTLLVCDGLLRSIVFSGDLFARLLNGFEESLARHLHEHRHLYLVGVAKHSKVLTRYRVAMALEGVLTADYPAYVEIPREMEETVYTRAEYARGNEPDAGRDGRAVRLAGGKMFFVKFGRGPHDPIWPVDIFLPQVGEAPTILGYVLADAVNGFPIPFYPRCLQRAHEHAALVDFDLAILQDEVVAGIRAALGEEAPVLDVLRLQEVDPAQARYGEGTR